MSRGKLKKKNEKVFIVTETKKIVASNIVNLMSAKLSLKYTVRSKTAPGGDQLVCPSLMEA